MNKTVSIIASLVMGASALTFNVISGWQLKGTDEDINVSVFNNPKIISVWSYDTTNKKWKAYIPNKNIDLSRYGIEKLTKINKYDGFWINSLGYTTLSTQISTQNKNPIETAKSTLNLLRTTIYNISSPNGDGSVDKEVEKISKDLTKVTSDNGMAVDTLGLIISMIINNVHYKPVSYTHLTLPTIA
jgi:hypothetical protein